MTCCITWYLKPFHRISCSCPCSMLLCLWPKASHMGFTLASVTGYLLGHFLSTNASSLTEQLIPSASQHLHLWLPIKQLTKSPSCWNYIFWPMISKHTPGFLHLVHFFPQLWCQWQQDFGNSRCVTWKPYHTTYLHSLSFCSCAFQFMGNVTLELTTFMCP